MAMMLVISFLVALVVLLAERQGYIGRKSSAARADMVAVTYPQWILLGDSITQGAHCAGGTGQALAEAYQRKIDVVNRGYSGYNSRWGLRVAPHIFPLTSNGSASPPLKAISIWWGANDATLPMRTQSIPIEEFKDNLNKFIDMFRSESSPHFSPGTTIFLLPPPPISISQRKEDVLAKWGHENLDRTFERTKQFAEAVREVAEQRQVVFVPLFDNMMAAAGPDPDNGLRQFLSDGLHLTPAGYQLVTKTLVDAMTKTHPELLPDNIPRNFPDWSEIDPNNPDASFPKP